MIDGVREETMPRGRQIMIADHGDAEQKHAVERRIEVLAEDDLEPLRMPQRLEAADHDDGGEDDAELAAHAAEHDDGEDDGGFHEGEASPG